MASSIDFTDLFDADALRRGGECPWTIFAYPKSLADSQGLPPDDVAIKVFAELQSRGIPMAIWVSEVTGNTTYFACRLQDRLKVDATIKELESQGTLERNYLSKCCDRLFSQVDTGL